MTKRNLVVLSLLVLASLALAACGGAAEYECADPIGCVDIAPDDPVHIAYMLTTTGATAFLGEDSLGAIELAIVDRGGSMLGHEILLTGEDSGCSPEGGQTAAVKVTTDPTIIGVVGTNCSSAATAAIDTISEAGLVMISSSNTAPALTDPEGTWKPGYFRACHNDKFQGRVAAEFVYNELGARTAATIHDGSPYADQLQEVFADSFVELGGTVTYQGAVNVGDTDMRTVLTSVAADSPDVLYFPIFEPEGPFIVAQSSEISGLENTVLVGADGLFVASFPENAGSNAEGMYLSGPYVSGASYDKFIADWVAAYGDVPPSGFHAFAYDGTNIMLDAIEKVAIQDEDGTLHIPRGALRDAMAATSGFEGLTGNLECNEYGDCATGEALGVFKVTNAEIVDDAWPPEAIYTP